MVVLSALGSSPLFASSTRDAARLEETAFSHLTPHLVSAVVDIARLSGAEELPSGGRVISRSVFHDDLVLAEEYVLDELFAEPRLTVWTEEVTGGTELNDVAVELPGLRNIIAELPGTNPELPPLVIGAHLDSTANRDPDWDPLMDPAPGADDDASGASIVLALARGMASWSGTYARTVRFVLFTAEEIGLQGSFAHVTELEGDVHLMLNLDPVGYNGGDLDRLWFSYDSRWPECEELVAEAAAEAASFLEVTGVDRGLLGSQSTRSDHYPFWEAGHRAIHFGTFPPPPDYHEQTDTLDVVDPEFHGEVALVVAALALREAMPSYLPPDPTVTGDGCACSASDSSPPLPLLLLLALALGRSRPR